MGVFDRMFVALTLTLASFPLQEHLVGAQSHVEPPLYVQQRSVINMSKAFEATDNEYFENIDVLAKWPENAETNLDVSQVDALRTILTKRLAIVQGPPGTGKTHVSVVALKVLLDNWKLGDPPIIVSCQTNHALDQLLRHVGQFEPDFVRLGGRSKDQGPIKERTMFNLRQSNKKKATGSYGVAVRRWKTATEDIKILLAPLENDSKSLLMPATLEKLGLLTEAQCQSLIEGDEDYVHENVEDQLPLEQWLGSQLEIVKRFLQPDDFGYEFEEAELEVEQLEEMEAEATAEEDDSIERLKGSYFDLFENFTGKTRRRLTDEEAMRLLQNENMWKIPPKHRGPVFSYIKRQAKAKILEQFRKKAKEHNNATLDRQIGGLERDFAIIQQNKLVGLTTTGLSKYRPLIYALNPKIVLIEEAAESIEAPVTTACVPSLEHLILVGDHQQLRPSCSVHELEGPPFNFNVSLFERMVINQVDFRVLRRQRRMIPEIRRLLEPIYGRTIYDHPIVKDSKHRPPVPGMGQISSFFFTHQWQESLDENNSAFNQPEADMVAAFFEYLVLNDVHEDKITVLTFYNGQRKAIVRALHKRKDLPKMRFKVATVDSYQGEENDVVILSLVRSNDRYSIGFLSVENRVCVALSRAKRGFYMFGNGELLCTESKLWEEVVQILCAKKGDTVNHAPKKRLGFLLPLTCQSHGRMTFVEHSGHFDNILPGAGCEMACKDLLLCGHPCTFTCHHYGHDRVSCTRPCERFNLCGHACKLECSDPCRCDQCWNDDQEALPVDSMTLPVRSLANGMQVSPRIDEGQTKAAPVYAAQHMGKANTDNKTAGAVKWREVAAENSQVQKLTLWNGQGSIDKAWKDYESGYPGSSSQTWEDLASQSSSPRRLPLPVGAGNNDGLASGRAKATNTQRLPVCQASAPRPSLQIKPLARSKDSAPASSSQDPDDLIHF